MKLIILYGPPAVGKLTVARELAKKTGYKLHHNHLTVDLVASVLSFSDEEFWPEVRGLRIKMLEYGVAKKQNLIFTYVYGHDNDDANIKKYIDVYEKRGGEICLVQLTADREEILKRVESESRLNTEKMKKPDELKNLMSEYELFKPINNRTSLTIDNTNLTPVEVVDQIIAHFHL